MEDRPQGGLTGATGSLTPSDQDDEFVPAETRAINEPSAARSVVAGRPADEPNSAGAVLGGDERHDPEEEHL